MTVLKTFLLLLSVIAVAPPATAQAIKGLVQDSTGAPLQNATVVLRGVAEGLAHTGADGAFAFTHLREGDYELFVTLSGFAPVSRSVHIAGADTMTVPLTLFLQILEQTIVTAARTGDRDAQDVPLAIGVLSGRDVQREQAHTIEDIARQVPSVTFSQNTGFAQLTIRGIGTNAVFAGSDPSSAVYVDGVYLARPAMALSDLLDVDRIEVLRGPQGTLYGRNAVGGALNVLTAVPTNDAQASARLVGGTFGTLRGEARASGPIIPDRMMGSAAVLRGVARGFVRDVDHVNQFLGGEDVTAAQGKMRVVLNRADELLVSADVTHQDPTPLTYAKVLAVKPGFTLDNPPDLHDVRTTTPGTSRNRQFGGSLRFTTQITPRTAVTSLTAFRKLDYDVVVDTDISELDLAVSDTHEIHHQWSEELTVAHTRPAFSWLGGLFLFDDEDWQLSQIRLEGPRLENRLNPDVAAHSRALFGQATIALTPSISATAGLRYTNEGKTIDNAGELSTLDAPISPVAGSSYAYSDAISESAWSPRIGLELRHNDHALSYVSATRGFKSGGFNITSTVPGRGFAPEWAWSYEAGVKTTVAGGRVLLNAATFYTDYTNLQVQTAIRPGVLDISNAASATIKGFEFENTTQLGSAVRAGGYLNGLDARYDRYLAVAVGGVTGDAAGHRLNNAPAWSAGAWLEWDHAVPGGGVLSIRPDAVWQSTAFFTPFNDTIQRQSPYALLNVSGEVRPPRAHLSLAMYARNLLNQDYITGTFSSPPPAIGGRPGPSRTAGVELVLRR